jgi:tetratricopeptide (TPR) repeat protein
MERRPAEALAAVRAMRDTATENGVVYRPRALLRAQAYAAMGDRARARAHFLVARAELERDVAARPRAARHFAALGLTYAGLGDRTRALAAADRALAIIGAPVPTLLGTSLTRDAAEIHLRVGDTDGALALLEWLLGVPAGREVSVALLRADPAWDALRADPRFERLQRRFAAR